MSSPRAIVQIIIIGSQILGKALLEAGRQAVRNAKHRPEGVASDVAGVGNAKTGSLTDKLTRDHRMTVDEAHLILNVKRGDPIEQVLKNYEHLFAVNSPPAPTAESARPTPRGGASKGPIYSHYLLSKVVRARERIEAEARVPEETPPPPDPPTSDAPQSGNDSGGKH